MRRTTALCLWLLATVATAQDRAGFATNGPLAPAKLVAIMADGGLTLESGGQRKNYPPPQLAAWGRATEPRRGPVVILADGSWLVGEPIALNSEEIRLDARLFGELALPRQAVRGIAYRLPADAPQRDALLDRISQRRDAGDLLLLANGDELTGRATGQKGADDQQEEQLLFAVGASKDASSLGLSKLAAIAFDSVLVDSAAPRGRYTVCTLRDGTRLMVTNVAAKAGRYELTLASGIKLRLEDDAISDDIAAWQPLGAGVVYLSDVADAGYKHIPFLSQTWPFHKDRNCHGGRLRSGGMLYAKGLGMRSTSRLAYDFDDSYRQFAAELALDDSAGTRGSVIFRVFTAGEGTAWKTAYESPVIRGGDPPLPITVDLAGAKRIALIVDFAERGDECDDADWLNARLMK